MEWLKPVGVIAYSTFKEAIRNRILYIILVFAILMIISGGVLADLSVSNPMAVILSTGLFGINFFSLLIAVMVGIGLVYNEIDKKTIYTIVSKPIDRRQFLLGKYFGLLTTIAAVVLLMGLVFMMAIHYYHLTDTEVMTKAAQAKYQAGGTFSVGMYNLWAFFQCLFRGVASFTFIGGNFEGEVWSSAHNVMIVVVMNLFEFAIIVAFAVLFSAFSTPLLSAFMTIMIFLVGRGSEDIMRYVWRLEGKMQEMAQSGVAVDTGMYLKYYLAQMVAYLSPNLNIFYSDLTRQAIYGEHGVTIYFTDLIYGLVYPAVILSLACVIFDRRNFK